MSNISVNNLEIKHEEQTNNQIAVIFETTSQVQIPIAIDPNKKMEELIELYFIKINRKDLIHYKNISFLKNGNTIPRGTTKLIKDYINGRNEGRIIIVVDPDDKIDNL